MKSKAISVMKAVFTSKLFFMALCYLFASVAQATTYTPTTGTAETAEELDSTWNKVAALLSGTGGKMAAVGVIGASVWNREKIGMLAMGVGIIIGVLIPSFPKIIDSFSYCI